MEKTNQFIENLNRVFNCINIFYDETDFTFDSSSAFLNKLQDALNTAARLNTNGLVMEIWDKTPQFMRSDTINQYITDNFDRLLTWKSEINDLSELNMQLPKDVEIFLKKQSLINRNYSNSEKQGLEVLYKSITHRLLKAKFDLIKVIAELNKMTGNEVEGTQIKKLESLDSCNIQLHPDVCDEFCVIIDNLYHKGFFIPRDFTARFTKDQMFLAFSTLFQTHLSAPVSTPSQPKNNEITTTSNGVKSFPEFLLHTDKYKLADDIKNEFSTEKGKSIRLLLYALESHNSPLIAIRYRQAKELHAAISHYFERNIGTYQSVFNYKVDKDIDRDDLDKITIRLNHLLSK